MEVVDQVVEEICNMGEDRREGSSPGGRIPPVKSEVHPLRLVSRVASVTRGLGGGGGG